jgi:hypothetical protein
MRRQLTASKQKEAFHLKLSGLFVYYYFLGGGEREREKIMYICIGDENPLKGYRKGDAKNFQRVIFAYDQVLCELRFFSNETSADGFLSTHINGGSLPYADAWMSCRCKAGHTKDNHD